jgi:hypothetical protein
MTHTRIIDTSERHRPPRMKNPSPFSSSVFSVPSVVNP